MLEAVQQKGKTTQGRLPFINPATGEHFGEIQTSTFEDAAFAVSEMKAARPAWASTP